ncbi:hypothetical protein CBLAS_1809 [Campylobacter blaseri]|uniref:GIY-YIG catalytic domain-containing protein n=1 Tax=Campylobacter blaseri TaxID=2042961 RepID=A0A2P8R3P6_9BACT|nr:hypothetical protein [Campylobacter blaseri]PSM53108.1 hypothetical protein CQ405_00730 [Campylobacter blaseri]PSM54574.1 hypothetical protein CRN67_00730 [Campylobacter blaseri]QKF86953.1 hypothetical protein CBLAS_1809 [Campylobacter blaseri]
MKNNQLRVADIRKNNIKITRNSILYCWWFKVSCFNILLEKLKDEIDFSRIKTKTIEGDIYGLLYAGKAKNGNERLVKYHILDYSNFHNKGVLNGRLSSLRTTLCGLLDKPMSKNKNYINDFIDTNCIVSWMEVCGDELSFLERDFITSNYLPLNYQHTKNILTKSHREILRTCKAKMKF